MDLPLPFAISDLISGVSESTAREDLQRPAYGAPAQDGLIPIKRHRQYPQSDRCGLLTYSAART